MKARIAFKHIHDLPPGSIGPNCRLGVQTDDQFYLRLQQEHGPIFKLFWGSRTLKICLVGFERGRRFLTQNKGVLLASLTEPNDVSSAVPYGYLRVMRGETHAHYRRKIGGAFSDDLVIALTDQFRNTVRRELSRLALVNPEEVSAQSLVEALNQITTRALLTLVFGVGPAGDLSDDLYDLYCDLGPHGHMEGVKKKQQAGAFANICQQVRRWEYDIRSGRDNRFADSIFKRLVLGEPDRMLDQTVVGNLAHMVERGRHDLRDLLRWTVKYLSDHTTVVEDLRDDVHKGDFTKSLAKACVMETLRLDQAETINRTTTSSIHFEGYRIPKNSRVSVLIRESHRDPAVFDRADSFCPHRFIERSFSRNEYSPFGVDAHKCIAEFFVLRFGAVFVEVLANEYRWQVIDDGPRHYGHFHWQPSQSFAILITEA
jgi:cytochrome P450